MSVVSVIVPVYNAEHYLKETLDRIVRQTFQKLEIILVDDGSTDSSLTILKDYEISDSRIRVFHQPNKGAGTARNLGMRHATGKYLMFLDCDDLFELDMVEKMYVAAEEREVNVLVCRSDHFDDASGTSESCPWTIKSELLPPPHNLNQVFSSEDIPKNFFELFVWWPWDKIFRRDYINHLHLEYQELRTTNDLFFVCCAVLMAKRISCLDDVLVHQRVGNRNSLSNTRELSWNNFLIALDALKNFLLEHHLYERFQQDFQNYVLNFSMWHLETIHGGSYCSLYTALREKWFPKFGISFRNHEYYWQDENYQKMCDIMRYDVAHHLINRLEDTKHQLEEIKHQVANLSHEKNLILNEQTVLQIERDRLQKDVISLREANEALLHSVSFRVGRILTWPLRKIRDCCRQKR